MKTLKWIWTLVLAVWAFKAYGLFNRASTADFGGAYAADINAFVGMSLILGIVTIIIATIWTLQKVKSALETKVTPQNPDAIRF